MIMTLPLLDPEKIRKTAETLKAVGHPVRLKIIEYLEAYNELSVGQLQELLKIGQSAVSQQLTLLRNRGVIQGRREGTTVFYTLDNRDVVRLIHCIVDQHEKRDND